MIGIDVIEIERIEKLKGDAFYKRLFTTAEMEYIASRNYSAQTISGLYAAKEAVLKALGSGIGYGASFQQINITHTSQGQPQVEVSGKCAENLEKIGERICLSISHTDKLAVAIAQVFKGSN